MSELKSWSPAAWGMTIGMVCAMIAVPVGVGYLAGAGWGWLAFGAIMLSFAKVSQGVYSDDRQTREREP